jgi:putative SOS response-associated peptidase YedK
MCGRYGFIPGKDFYDRFEITNRDLEFEPDYNVAPGMIMPVVTKNSPKKVEKMKWGLIPFWAKDPKIGYQTINARSEELAGKPSFREPFKRGRCLIPASGFYEWAVVGKEKYPYYFRLRSGEMFAFAGLYDTWKDAEGKAIKTYTIITTRANTLVNNVHPRMPVILQRLYEDIWADNSTFDGERLQKMLMPYPAIEMDGWGVSLLVNNTRNNQPELIKPKDG